jgi:cytochrome b subunit of formate dehydrogenase
MQKNLYFTFILLVELAIAAAFVWFLIYLFPTLDPDGYLFYGDAPHVPYLEQEISSTAVTVVRWIAFVLTACLILPMMFTILAELVRWQINRKKSPAPLPFNDKSEEQVVRFDFHLKIQHYLIMIGVTVAGIFGLAQAFPDWAVSRWFVEEIWGGLELKRQFHHYFAYIIDFTVFYFIGYLAYKFFIKKDRLRAMLPSLKDLRDFFQMNLYILGLRKEEPKYNRYTFGQKLDFYLIAIGIPTLSLTGLAMHYTTVSESIITSTGIALAAVIHRSVAIFLVWFILSVHFYYAHLSPGLFPVNTVILTGKMGKSRYKALFPLDKERLEGDDGSH